MDTDFTVKVPTFNGNVKNFMLWLVRFEAFAVKETFIGAIQVAGDADLPAEENCSMLMQQRKRKKNRH
jgi:hypothetical protein